MSVTIFGLLLGLFCFAAVVQGQINCRVTCRQASLKNKLKRQIYSSIMLQSLICKFSGQIAAAGT